ncbi:two-component regulator propeller domain-containing protein [Aquiflexum sp.]|uniref:two-component regulator propeller domain-containing protein n=1 Tax=Aquiflexum sp. TaxID=1872584 RepID=UPI0035931938
MKKLLIFGYLFTITLFSCETENGTSDETSVILAVGKVNADSSAMPIITPIAPRESVHKSAYEISKIPYSLAPENGKEVISAFTASSGFSLRHYQNIIADEQGNMWLGTFQSPLIKFDGNSFRSYYNYNYLNEAIGNGGADNNNHHWLIKHTREDTYEIASMVIFDGFRFVESPGPIVSKSLIKPMILRNNLTGLRGSDNRIWVANNIEKTITQFEGRNLIASYDSTDFPFGEISLIKEDREGNVYFVEKKEKKITLLKDGNFSLFSPIELAPNDEIIFFYPVSSDTSYIGTNKGIHFYDGKKAYILNSLLPNRVILDGDNHLWAVTLAGILKIKGLTVVNFNDQKELSEIEHPVLGADRDRNIWVSGMGFLGRFDRTFLAYPNLIESTSQNRSIREMFQTKKGDYYFGTYFDGLFHYDGKNLINYSFVQNQIGNYGTINNISSIEEDPSGNIWILSANGDLKMFDGNEFHTYHLSDNPIFSIYSDSNGNIWFTEDHNNLLCYFNGKEKVCFGTAQGLSDGIITAIYEDDQGVMWFGTVNGLNKFENGLFSYFTEDDGLPWESLIRTISGDSHGNIWIGTTEGLSRFDGNLFTNFTVEDGLKINFVADIRSDNANQLIWISTIGEGLLALRKDTLASKGVVFEEYSEGEGFSIPATSEFFPDQEGNIWFSKGHSSLYRFDYKKLKDNGKPFPIHISNILINNQPVLWSQINESYSSDSLIMQTEMIFRFGHNQNSGKNKNPAEYFRNIRYDSLLPYDFIPVGLKLPYAANSISFEFAAIDPHFSKNTRYQYRLEGFDDNWSPLEKNNIARFGNLWDGDYTLRIKALNPYGLWSEMEYSFSVLPPWWRTKFAYLIYLLLFGFLGWRIHLIQKARTIRIEREKTKDRELAQAKEIEKAYSELKSTQAQLIQSEKMASLGELTAGIAHEIQNPLNFVNNFSEVSAELVDEIKESRAKTQESRPKTEEDEIEDEILEDIKQNLEKINHHGKRADAIVKGMLEHSRTSTGERVLTDINALADEYLRLSYHGMRAKDKSFNADFKTDFDPNLPKINVVSQDIGRVLLNIINNAFQAVGTGHALSLQPLVTVSTSTLEGGRGVRISIKDNGPGIPDAIKDKIFQPFFTTKPTGQGTGLGLSLSYDIVKAHGGELKIKSEEGNGSVFIILLPLVRIIE